jgi:hypothetical protein
MGCHRQTGWKVRVLLAKPAYSSLFRVWPRLARALLMVGFGRLIGGTIFIMGA